MGDASIQPAAGAAIIRGPMQRLLEYFAHHPWLSGAALAAGIALLVNELLMRGRAAASISPSQAVALINQGALVLDVRSREEFDSGHIGNARNVISSELASSLDGLRKWREKNVILYCQSGARSLTALNAMSREGFTKVFNLAGGIEAWRKDNLPVVK